MHSSVSDFYFDFTATSEIEGVVEHMYLDNLGWVTVGVGTLIENPDHTIRSEALGFEFFFRGNPGRPAGEQDIRNDFNAVNSMAPGLGHAAYRPVAQLDLAEAEMRRIVNAKLLGLEASLRQIGDFSGMDGWPADAQLGLLSMAYAMGGAFAAPPRWPGFRAAAAAQDFVALANNSHMNEANNPNLRPRNWANELMFIYASRILQYGLPTDMLIFPDILTSSGTYIEMGLAPRHAVWPTLRINATGKQVEALQTLLDLQPTGSFDSGTQAAVVQFQSTATDRDGQPLTPDGVVGLQTWRALVLR